MWTILLKVIIKIAGSEIGKEAIRLGAEKLVESTDNGIDNQVLGIFLDKASESKRNVLSKDIVSELKKRL